jgi:hypothetical protein
MSAEQEAFAAAVNESWRRGRRTGMLEGILILAIAFAGIVLGLKLSGAL